MKEGLRGRKVTRPSLLAVIGPIRQQPTPCWETSAAWCCWTSRRSVMAIPPWQPANQWGEREKTGVVTAAECAAPSDKVA